MVAPRRFRVLLVTEVHGIKALTEDQMTRYRVSFAAAVIMAALFWLTLGAPIASADIIYSLTAGNADISGYTGPYGTVRVSLIDSTHATITFTSLTQSGNIYLFGDGGSVAVNVNATNWTLGSITGSNDGTGFSPGSYSNGNSGNEDGFGSFNQRINSFDGFSHSADTVTFTLTNTSSGGNWASAANVLIENDDGYAAGAHIFVTSSPADASNGALATGYAAGGPDPVPDGGMTLMLLGGALFALETLRRRLGA